MSVVPLLAYSASNCGDLKNWVRGRSRSLKMAPIDRSCTTYYLSDIIIKALSLIVFELLDIEGYRGLERLEIDVRGY